MTSIFLIAGAAGACTILGAAVIFFTQRIVPVTIAWALSIAAGAMVYVSFLELIPEALQHLGAQYGVAESQMWLTLFFVVGACCAGIMDYFIPQHDLAKGSECCASDSRLARAGVFIFLGLTIHNIPEGVGIYATVLQDLRFGLTVALGIAIHNLPAGVVLAFTIFAGTQSRRRVMICAAIAGLAQPLGALIGFMFFGNHLPDTLIGIIYAMVAGILTYISLDELLPMAKKHGREHQAIVGFFIGFIFLSFATLFF